VIRPRFFDNAGRPSVLPQREKDNVVTHRDQRIAEKNERRWNAGGMEVSFDSGHDQGVPKNGGEGLNDLLTLLVFGGRPGFEPALNKSCFRK
jgi:hypothetical protein